MSSIVKLIFSIGLLNVVVLLWVYTFKIGWSGDGPIDNRRKMLQRNQTPKSPKRLFERVKSSPSKDVKAVQVSSTNGNFYRLMQRRLEHVKNACRKHSGHSQSLTSKATLNVSMVDNSNAQVRMYMLKKEKVAF